MLESRAAGFSVVIRWWRRFAERLEKIQHEMMAMAHCEVESGCIARAIHRVAVEKSANLIMTGRSRPGTISLGVQNHILAIDNNGPCPVLSVL
jgi:hypothetical protein